MKSFRSLFALVLALAVMFSAAVSSFAEDADEALEQQAYYMLGDDMADFSARLCDGTEVTLSELLETKKMVLINFWATWCGPCRSEFPAMEEAYTQYADQVAVVALSVESTDTDEVIAQFKEENGLINLPMGQDVNGLSDGFYFEGIPTSIVVDRFGKVVFQETGSVPDASAFCRLFDYFAGDEYTETGILTALPAPRPNIPNPSEDEMNAALNVEGGALTFACNESEEAWPFLPDGDGALVNSNSDVNMSCAMVETNVVAGEGDVLSFDCKTSTEAGMDLLKIMVDGSIKMVRSGEMDWATYAFALSEGEHKVQFMYAKDEMESAGDDKVWLDNVRLLSGSEAAAALDAMPKQVKTLEGDSIELRVISENAKEAVITDLSGMYIQMMGAYPSYVAHGDTLKVKVLLGEELDANTAVIMGDYDYEFVTLIDVEHDDEGYIVELPLSSVEAGSYSNTYITVFPNFYEDPDTFDMIYVYATEENLNYFARVEMPEYGVENVLWVYKDGSLPSTTEVAQEPDELPEGMAEYIIQFVDQNGEPVIGAMAQVCDADTCEVLPSDEYGLVACVKPVYAYEIHVLALPEGYDCDKTQVYTMEELGGLLTITVDKAE